jgi:hypothetical protein
MFSNCHIETLIHNLLPKHSKFPNFCYLKHLHLATMKMTCMLKRRHWCPIIICKSKSKAKGTHPPSSWPFVSEETHLYHLVTCFLTFFARSLSNSFHNFIPLQQDGKIATTIWWDCTCTWGWNFGWCCVCGIVVMCTESSMVGMKVA